MSRDLEREYRAYVDSEVPDLWARIEAGLEDKKLDSGSDRTDLHRADLPAVDSRGADRRGRKINFRLWAGIAAACACVALAVPAMMRSMVMGRSGFSSSNSASDSASSAAPQAADAYVTADTAGQEEAACEEGVDCGVTEEKAVALDSFRVTVEILDVDLRMDSGVLYTAKVLSSDAPEVEPDSEIQIFSTVVPLEEVKNLERGQTYDLALRERQSDNAGQGVTYLLVDE